MSIANEIERIQKAKNDIATSIANKGVTVPEDTKIDGYSALVDQITGGEVADPTVLILDVENIADGQFADGVGLEGIKTLILPNVKTIGVVAFSNSELEVIDVGEKVTSVHATAFNQCSKLTTLIFRGESFSGSNLQLTGTPIKNGLGYIYVPDNYVEQYKTSECFTSHITQIKSLLLLGDTTLQSKTVTPTKEQQIVSPDSNYYGLGRVVVESIPDMPDAFVDWSTILALDSAEISTQQFMNGQGLDGIETVILPKVTNISYQAFASATTIKTIDVGDKINSVKETAFNHCSNLTKVIFRKYFVAANPIELRATPFAQNKPEDFFSLYENGGIYVPDGDLTKYKNVDEPTSNPLRNFVDFVRPLSELKDYPFTSKRVTPTKEQQFVTPEEKGDILCSVMVGAIPDKYWISEDVAGELVLNTVNVPALNTCLTDVKKLILPNVETISGNIVQGTDIEVVDIGDKIKTISTAAFSSSATNPAKLHTLIIRGLLDDGAGSHGSVILSWTPIYDGNGYIYVPDEYVEQYKAGAFKNYASQVKPLSEFDEGGGEGIPEGYADVSKVTATADDVLLNKKFVAADGTLVTGTMSNDGGSGINPEWTNWGYLSWNNNRNELVAKLKYTDTSNGTTFNYMVGGCSTLTEVPAIDTSKGKVFQSMFTGCSALKTINKINVTGATSVTMLKDMFNNCTALENITFEGTFPVKYTLSVFSTSPNLTVDSLMSFINALSDNTGLSSTYTVTIGSTNLAKLTPEQIKIATDKNIALA